jgi:hypothetical protein
MQFHTLPPAAKDALVACAVELAGQPWDAVVRPPGNDPKFRETLFGSGNGILGFFVDEEAELIRVFNIVWLRLQVFRGEGYRRFPAATFTDSPQVARRFRSAIGLVTVRPEHRLP